MRLPAAACGDVALTDALLRDALRGSEPGDALSLRLGPLRLRAAVPAGVVEPLLERYAPFLDVAGDEGAQGGPYQVEAARHPDLDLMEFPRLRAHAAGATHYVYRWDFVARIDTRARRAALLMAPVAAPLCVDAVLRIVTSFAALDAGGFLLHAAAVADARGAFVFCGVSGAGKTTVARLSLDGRDGRDVLTDEMTLLERRPDGGYTAWGTPFWGALARGASRAAPLRALLFLEQGHENVALPLAPADGLRALLKVVLCFGQDAPLCQRLLDEAGRLLAAVPPRRLRFRPEPALWSALA